ncbi:MAG: polyphosphate kinase 2 family protein [Sedimenticolaceae bacterium]|nr:polyphosphate kinase 2 family protein [Sedimenticolaceae bacterium]
MIKTPETPWLVPTDGSFSRNAFSTHPPAGAPDEKACRKHLKQEVKRIDELQRRLYADDRHSLLLVFQAMDAAGKDSTIRAVLRGVNPAGCQVSSFKQPSKEELDHDYLWRSVKRLPERGRIGVFNRSYYEEVLVVRVHPEYLGGQRLVLPHDMEQFWKARYRAISDHEKHLSENGTVILKFWLNVSKEEQKRRFLSRLNEPEKHWKFSSGDLEERKLWEAYMEAYQQALSATSTPWAPWFAIPADSKPYMRWQVAKIIRKTLEAVDPRYPSVSPADLSHFQAMRDELNGE